MPKAFSLEKLKNRVGRRFSEPSAFDLSATLSSERRNSTHNPIIIVSEPDFRRTTTNRMRASSLSTGKEQRSRSHSVSRKQAKELIRQETSHIILKKLNSILSELGLQLPIAVKSSSGLGGLPAKLIKLYVSNTNDCVYLAPAVSASFTYEDVENGGEGVPEEQDLLSPRDPDVSPPLECSTVSGCAESASADAIAAISSKMRTFSSPNYLCTQIDSDTQIPHVFAVIVELKKESSVKYVLVEFSSSTQTLWPAGESHSRFNLKEKFKIGAMEWTLAMLNADCFISTTNSNDTKFKDISEASLAKRTRKYELVRVGDLADGTDAVGRKSSSDSVPEAELPLPRHHETCKAGLYVFLLPVLLPPQIPATINSVNGSLNHRLAINVHCVNEKINKRALTSASYNLPMVRTPPSLANSIADKPIYVNRVWNDALHYVITFPKKYIALGSEHTINVKLVPLVKDVVVKRIKFNVLERLTYVSKDLTKEYEYDGEDPFLIKPQRGSKTRERIVPVCELKTKQKNTFNGQLEPYKEEIINCPDNNLLFSCYEQNLELVPPEDPLSRKKNSDYVMIASPLDISIALPFLTTKADKEMLTSSIEEEADQRLSLSATSSRKASIARPDAILGVCPSSPIIGSLETHISHVTGDRLLHENMNEDILKLESSSFMLENPANRRDTISRGYTTTAKALAPDSNFRHIQISHRLQVCFRISKPDAADNFRMHHYEVVVDTPLILLSAKCNEESIQLPKYDEIDVEDLPVPPSPHRGITFRMPSFNKNGVTIKQLDPSGDEQLPSFEEAVSTAASPIMRSFSLGDNAISRMGSITPSEPAPAYDYPEFALNEAVSQLNIDDLVLDSSSTSGRRKESAIHASLGSRFAPHMQQSSSSDSSQIDRGNCASPAPFPSDLGESSSINQLSMESTDSAVSPHGGVGSADSVPISGSLSEHTATSDPGFQPVEAALSHELDDDEGDEVYLLSEIPCDLNTSLTRDGAESIFTQDTQFDQKLPLLQNASTDNVGRASILRKSRDELTKMLSDTLSQEPTMQSLFHAY